MTDERLAAAEGPTAVGEAAGEAAGEGDTVAAAGGAQVTSAATDSAETTKARVAAESVVRGKRLLMAGQPAPGRPCAPPSSTRLRPTPPGPPKVLPTP